MKLIRSLSPLLCAGALSLATALSTAPVAGAEGIRVDHGDWPCDQILVPQIAAATVWDGPAVDGLAWRANAPVAQLVGRITPRTTSEAAAAADLDAFTKGLAAPQRNQLLTLVFAGALEVLNQERAREIDGIRRYSQDQARRAEALGADLDRMVALERDPAASARERDDLKGRLTLEERVFDEREKAIGFLCTRPAVLEQRLGFLARSIAALMD